MTLGVQLIEVGNGRIESHAGLPVPAKVRMQHCAIGHRAVCGIRAEAGLDHAATRTEETRPVQIL